MRPTRPARVANVAGYPLDIACRRLVLNLRCIQLFRHASQSTRIDRSADAHFNHSITHCRASRGVQSLGAGRRCNVRSLQPGAQTGTHRHVSAQSTRIDRSADAHFNHSITHCRASRGVQSLGAGRRCNVRSLQTGALTGSFETSSRFIAKLSICVASRLS